MRRKIVVAFRAMLEEYEEAANNAGFHGGDHWDADGIDEDRRAKRLRRKIERFILPILDANALQVRQANAGFWVNNLIPRKELEALAKLAPMQGNRFTAGHAIDYDVRNAKRAK